jgi:hypothetical protein
MMLPSDGYQVSVEFTPLLSFGRQYGKLLLRLF